CRLRAGDVHAPVLGRAAERVAPVPRRLRCDLADEVRGAGEKNEGEEEQHVDQPLKETIFLRMSEPMAIIRRPPKISLWPVPVFQSGLMNCGLSRLSTNARKNGRPISTYADIRPIAVSPLILRANCWRCRT